MILPTSDHKTIFLYGAPGTGKSTIGGELARELELTFADLDEIIEAKVGKTIPKIFELEGEGGFRLIEKEILQDQIADGVGVISLGGGALLDFENRTLVENRGEVICLYATEETLLERLHFDSNMRPLLKKEPRQHLKELLEERRVHYDSFPLRLDTTGKSTEMLVWEIQYLLGMFRVKGMGGGYDVKVKNSGIEQLGNEMGMRQLDGPVALVSDRNVASFYAGRVKSVLEKAGYEVHTIIHPAGEENKTIRTIDKLWEGFLAAGLDRNSTVVALGGGVVGDLAGFAAATYKRGIKWVVVPTTLLAMCDASLGGKTGVDVPQGKNLIGAFHSPNLVYVDPMVLATLPLIEQRNGMAEIIKHGIIGDPDLFNNCRWGWDWIKESWRDIIVRAMAVKIKIIQNDPFENGERAVLNLGHTLGHAIETVTNYRIKHGEAVSIGMVLAALLAEKMGIAEPGLSSLIQTTLERFGLPISMPDDIDLVKLLKVISQDKKRVGGTLRVVLPVRIGEVRWGVEIKADEFFKIGGRQ